MLFFLFLWIAILTLTVQRDKMRHHTNDPFGSVRINDLDGLTASWLANGAGWLELFGSIWSVGVCLFVCLFVCCFACMID